MGTSSSSMHVGLVEANSQDSAQLQETESPLQEVTPPISAKAEQVPSASVRGILGAITVGPGTECVVSNVETV